MKKCLPAVVFILAAHASYCQPICGFDDFHKQSLANPVIAEKLDISEKRIQQYIKANPITPVTQGIGTALYQIPVVVHVVHTGGAVGTVYNPSDAVISETINYLNQSYDGTAAGFSGGAGDIQIQFVLAKRDPNCNPTNGIDRVNGSSLVGYTASGVRRNSIGISDAQLKDLSRWDPARYYNVWLVNKIDGLDGTTGQFIAGYAAFAGSAATVDGTVLLATQMYVGSKVLPHELGHALNLYHPFQGSSSSTVCPANGNCSVDGDRVCDTDPISYNATTQGVVDFSCRTGTNNCTGLSYKNSTESNVMNYTNCFTLFTAGQKDRMIAAMSLPSRQSLAVSDALQLTSGGSFPCAPKVNFTLSEDFVTESTDAVSGCRGYKDYAYSMSIGNSPSLPATIALATSGSASAGFDYILTTNGNFDAPSNTLTFPAGAIVNQSFFIRVFNDAAVENNETLVVNFTINNGGGNVVKGDATPVLTINIKDNDLAPQAFSTLSATIGQSAGNIGNSDGSQPIDAKLAGKKTVFLYKASELTEMGLTAGTITNFGIYLTKNSTRAITSMEIRAGQTTRQTLVDSFYYTFSLPLVKSVASYNTVDGLNLFALNNSFVWNGTSSIVIQICYNNGKASATQLSDVTLGYADGSSASQGNMYWQNVNCATSFNSVSYYPNGIKPVGYFTVNASGPQVETQLNNTATANLGPFDDVYFYGPTGNVLARIKNLTAFNYGCTNITIDRSGSSGRQYTTNVVTDDVTDKTVMVVPQFNNPAGAYEITLYYKTAEVNGWKALTGKNWLDAKIVKTPAAVSSYTEGQVPQSEVTVGSSITGAYGADSTITATFSNGFSGFAAGNPVITASPVYTFTGNGLWSNPTNWTSNTVPPPSLPSGSKIIINPAPNGECLLNIQQTILPGANLTVNPGKSFVVQGNLNISQ